MHPFRRSLSLLASVAAALAFVAAAGADETEQVVKFSQPDQPGTLKIQLARGTLDIRGADTAEVRVKSTLPASPKSPRKDGLRVLTSSASFSLTEKDNVITLDATSDGFAGARSSFSLVVPAQTSLIVQNSWGGDITCTGLAGDIEINGMNGSIKLDDVAGGIAVSTMNGEIRARVRELREGKTLSFQSMNGEVLLRLPTDARANVRIRTQNGTVLTDFDENALVTKTEVAGGPAMKWAHPGTKSHEILTPQARDAIREAARVGAEAVREAAEAIREAAEAAREGAEVARSSTGRAPTPPRPPRPPKPTTIPTITGGKLVTGTLNGGGPEISIATMNGDVTLRRVER